MGQTTLQPGGSPRTVDELEDLAFELRSKLLHLCGTYEGAVHIGGDLSAADIFTALANVHRSVWNIEAGRAAVADGLAAMRAALPRNRILLVLGLGAVGVAYITFRVPTRERVLEQRTRARIGN